MPRGNDDSNDTLRQLAASKSKGSKVPPSRSKSASTAASTSSSSNSTYLKSRRRDTREIKERKTSVADSLGKFLNDCTDDDLLFQTAQDDETSVLSRRRKKDGLSSSSEHVSGTPLHKRQSLSTSQSQTGRDSTAMGQVALLSASDHITSPRKSRVTRSTSDHGGSKSKKPSSSTSSSSLSSSSSSSKSKSSSRKHPSRSQSENLKSSGRFDPVKEEKPEEESSNNSSQQSFGEDNSQDDAVEAASSSRASKDGSSSPRRRRSSSKPTSHKAGAKIRRATSDRSNHRRKPTRSMSDYGAGVNTTVSLGEKLDLVGRSNRRQSMKERYRSNSDDGSFAGSVRSEAPLRRYSMTGDDRSVVSSASRMRPNSGKVDPAAGLDAGPLNAFLGVGRSHSMSHVGSGGSVVSSPAGDFAGKPVDEEWLRSRAKRQEDILNVAMKEKWERESQESKPKSTLKVNDSCDDIPDGEDDDDQPRVKRKANNGLRHVVDLVTKTAGVTKTVARGSVDAVRDPKKAAKKVGNLTKDVAKGTVNVVMDPKKAAKKAVHLTKDGVLGTVKLGTHVTTGVTKGGLMLTKTVAMSGFDATTMVVGVTTDGLGKVVHGAAGLIFKGELGEEEEMYADYDAKALPERRKGSMSLVDRVSGVIETDPKGSNSPAKPVPRPMAANSMLVPIPGLTTGKGNWDL